ncbi:MAG TPA: glycosyl hydrolase [Labilithrix sp.]|nr:glycosyl hydrolase [Labilithrix sp.]
MTSCHLEPRTSARPVVPRRIEPSPALVDPQATEETKDLAVQLDASFRAHVMIAGQQLPLWDEHSGTFWRQPLDDLGPVARDVLLVGFAADEYMGRSSNDRVAIMNQLEAWAKTEHKVLSVSWYPHNPSSPKHDAIDWSTMAGTAWDRVSKVDLRGLVDRPSSAEGQRFWRYFEATVKPTLIELARRKMPVVFRPLLEGNGDWFWWGCGGYAPAETTACMRGYNALYGEIQRRVSSFEVTVDGARAHVHSVLWEFSFSPWPQDGSGEHATDGLALRPTRADGTNAYDIAGISAYDETPDTVSELPSVGLASLAKLASVSSRVALDEVGPQRLKDRQWDPVTVVTTLRQWNATAKTPLYPLWARFWCDDEWEDVKQHKNPSFKQLSSFESSDRGRTGVAWLTSSDRGRFQLAP